MELLYAKEYRDFYGTTSELIKKKKKKNLQNVFTNISELLVQIVENLKAKIL